MCNCVMCGGACIIVCACMREGTLYHQCVWLCMGPGGAKREGEGGECLSTPHVSKVMQCGSPFTSRLCNSIIISPPVRMSYISGYSVHMRIIISGYSFACVCMY